MAGIGTHLPPLLQVCAAVGELIPLLLAEPDRSVDPIYDRSECIA